jgi:hypothetical protein
MKKFISLIVLGLITLFIFQACSDSRSKQASTSLATQTDTSGLTKGAVKYTCTMHPEVISDTPGFCPKCGMALVVKKMESKSVHHGDSIKK